jgi:nucleotide-binding universal stress UspA family protein
MMQLAERPSSHMLVAVDASEASVRAVRLAIGLSRGKSRARITFCHVVDVPLMVSRAEQCVEDYAFALRVARNDARRMLETCRSDARASGIDAQACVRYGRPSAEIITFAQLIHADLVVIGNHASSALHRFFRGSTRDELVRGSIVPVLVAGRGSPG